MNPKPRLITSIALAFAIIVTCGTAFAKHHAAVFRVLPTGTNDTANLQAAFDAAVQAGPGSTVQLVKGTYYIEKDIVVVNFDGSLVGAGKEKTFVQNLDLNPFPAHQAGKPFPMQVWSGLFVFYQDQNAVPSSITISDLTFRAIGLGTPLVLGASVESGITLNGMNILEFYGKFTGVRNDEVAYLNTSIIRVGFEGQSGDQYTFGGYNLINAAEISSEVFLVDNGDGSLAVDYDKPLSGTHLVQDCIFRNALFGWNTTMLQDSHVKVEGSTFENVRIPIGIYDFGNSTADIQRNRVHNATWSAGVYIANGIQATIGQGLGFGPHGALPAPSTVRISHNQISNSEYADGIGVVDWGYLAGETTIKHTVISDNNIRLEGTALGAISEMGASGVTVRNNRISGQGGWGIYTGWNGDPVSDWVIVGNHLKNADTDVSPIALGPSTSHFFVVADPADVLDMGTENIVIDVKSKH